MRDFLENIILARIGVSSVYDRLFILHIFENLLPRLIKPLSAIPYCLKTIRAPRGLYDVYNVTSTRGPSVNHECSLSSLVCN